WRFFFQAEDGIRDRNVTGVQTCALPISSRVSDRFDDNLKELAVDCVPLAESVAAYAAVEAGGEIYAYLFSREFGAVNTTVLARTAERAGDLVDLRGLRISAARLQPVFDTP